LIEINPSVQTLHLKTNFETVLIAHKSPTDHQLMWIEQSPVLFSSAFTPSGLQTE